MDIKKIETAFLLSALDIEGFTKSENILEWVEERRKSVNVNIDLIPFKKLDKWRIDSINGNLCHETGRFFSIEGVNVKTNWRKDETWMQPIINQPEVGILRIITKKLMVCYIS